MKREANVHQSIGPFTITVDQLEHLIFYVESELTGECLRLSDIEINSKDTKLSYEDVTEFKNHQPWNDRIDKFAVKFRNDDFSKYISISGGTENDNDIYVSGDDAAWVTGASKEIRNKMRRYTRWYGVFFKDIFSGFLSFAFAYIAILALIIFMYSEFAESEIVNRNYTSDKISWPAILVWIAPFPILMLMFRFAPKTSKIVQDKKKHNVLAIWGLLIGLGGLAVGLAKLFF